MVHTFELSKTVSRETFNEIIHSLGIRLYGNCWATSAYKDKGFPLICLFKFQRQDIKEKTKEDSDLTHHYMVTLSINTAYMFGGNGDPHLSQSILNFTPDYVRAIYRKIFELIPSMEEHPEWCFDNCWEEAKERNIADDEDWINEKKELNRKWMEANVFKARRIDFAFDLKYMNQQYLSLINRGDSLREDAYERKYYEKKGTQTESSDDEPDIPDSEEILKMLADDEAGITNEAEKPDNSYRPDVNYVYYKGKGKHSTNVNIYHKQTELEKKQLEFNPDMDYDFLRIEIQLKKNKLNYIVSKFGLKGRELHYLITPEVEEYVLKSYIMNLTKDGTYVTYNHAMKIIDNSHCTKPKKEKLKKIIDTVAKKHGVAKVLEEVKNGPITDLGELKTVKQYLKDIRKLGINPVTISARMEVPKQTLKNQNGGKDLSEKVLPSLVDILIAYGDQIKDYQQNGMPVTDEEIEQIMKL